MNIGLYFAFNPPISPFIKGGSKGDFYIIKIVLIIIFLPFISGCATFKVQRPTDTVVRGKLKVVRTARNFLGKKEVVVNNKKYNYDCSNFVRAVYIAGCETDLFSNPTGRNGVEMIYNYCQKNGVINQERIGGLADLVFFRDTYDIKKKKGTKYGNLTHIGIVDKIKPDGTIFFIHLNSQGIVRDKMNIDYPHDKTKNSYLRRKKETNGHSTEYLSGELFVAFAAVIE